MRTNAGVSRSGVAVAPGFNADDAVAVADMCARATAEFIVCAVAGRADVRVRPRVSVCDPSLLVGNTSWHLFTRIGRRIHFLFFAVTFPRTFAFNIYVVVILGTDARGVDDDP